MDLMVVDFRNTLCCVLGWWVVSGVSVCIWIGRVHTHSTISFDSQVQLCDSCSCCLDVLGLWFVVYLCVYLLVFLCVCVFKPHFGCGLFMLCVIMFYFQSDVPDELFNLISLEVLSLGQNKISTLPHCINQLTNLKQLYLFNNKLESEWLDVMVLLFDLVFSFSYRWCCVLWKSVLF